MLLKNIDGKKTIQDLSSLLSVEIDDIYAMLLPWMDSNFPIIQLRDRGLGPKHSALLQMIAPHRATQIGRNIWSMKMEVPTFKNFIKMKSRMHNDILMMLKFSTCIRKPTSLSPKSFLWFSLAKELCSRLDNKTRSCFRTGSR